MIGKSFAKGCDNMEKPTYDHAFSVTAEAVWNMENTHEFLPDFEGHYKGLLNMIDVLYYRNGNSYYPKVKSRHAAFLLALAMPSFAFIDPHRSLEMKYNLHAAAIAIENEELTYALDPYNSEQIRLLEAFVTLAMYKLVSEKKLNDEHFHELAEKVYTRIIRNGLSEQRTFAYDTIEGTYQVYPNALALLGFELHDRFFETKYLHKIKDDVLNFLLEKLIDGQSGLFNAYYKTGSLGYEGESLVQSATWTSKTPDISANALGIAFMKHFESNVAENAWKAHKEAFTDKILSVTAEALTNESAASYLSPVNPVAEGMYSTLLAAKEMNDPVYFEDIQKHLFSVSAPSQREGKVFFDMLGNEQALHGNFLAFARVHVGWDKLLQHNWEDYYKYDYQKVR